MSDKLSIDSQFNSFVNTRNNEIDIRWKKVQIFFLINSVLIGFITSSDWTNLFKLGGCVAGFSIVVIWYAIQLEAQYAIDYWNSKIAELEITKGLSASRFDFKYPHEGFRYKYFSTYYLILSLVTVFAIVWLCLIIFYISTL